MKKYIYLIATMTNLFGQEYNLAPNISGNSFQKKMVVTVASYNNEKYFQRNLDSIFQQDYENYHVIYVDDASTDDTWNLVSKYVSDRNLQDKITLIHNEENQGPMYNHYLMANLTEDESIIVTVDGDDWLADNNVLSRVNRAYLDERVWVTYGEFKTFPVDFIQQCEKVKCTDLALGKHREMAFIWSHLRTYYAGLFKRVPVEKWKDDDGNFFAVAGDVSIMLNLIDLAREHTFFIPDTLYIYNYETPLSECKIYLEVSDKMAQLIKDRPPIDKVHDWRM